MNDLKKKWASIPGVSFSSGKNETEVLPPPSRVRRRKVRKKRKVRRIVHLDTPEEDEMSSIEAAKLMGISTEAIRKSLIWRGAIPSRKLKMRRKAAHGVSMVYYLRVGDVMELWKKLCEVKGVNEGEKLGDLSFLQHMPKKERIRYFVDRATCT